MADKSKAPDRDKALINILERIGGELQRQGDVLDDLVRNQEEFSRALRSAEFQLGSQQTASEQSIDKIAEAMSHYRSGMLSLVNEQDRANENLKDMRKMIHDTNFALETSNQGMAALNGQVNAQDKAMREFYDHSLAQETATQEGIADNGRTVAKLHTDTEKRIVELHRETQGQLDKLQQDTTRRLMALVGIEEALNTLLIRTEPPEKKPLMVVRVLKKIGVFFRTSLPAFLKKVFLQP